MNDFNSTELFDGSVSFEEGGGEQERGVDSHESQHDKAYILGGDGQEEVVDPREADGEEMDFGAGESADNSGAADRGGVQKQTREDNSAARLARLRAEREADEKIARSGLLNPVTGSPFRSVRELESFGAAHQRDFIVKDAQDFRKKHPDVDIVKLEQNDNFRKFCGSRYGVESLASLYDDYRSIVGGAENAGRAVAESRSRRSTGSGGVGGEMLNAHQRARLDAWNRENPDMKMTVKEFLAK